LSPESEEYMRIMAIDYGDAHTGVAVSDPTGFLTGFTTTITAYRPETVAEQLASLAREKCWPVIAETYSQEIYDEMMEFYSK